MPPKDPSPDDMMKLHLAEYQALTGRWNSMLAVMFTVWTVAFAYLGFVIHGWNSASRNAPMILWSTLLIEQTITLAWLSLLFEQYGITLYFETDLRSFIVEALGARPFWGYQYFLVKHRGKVGFLRQIWEWLGAALSCGALIGVLIYRLARGWSIWDFLPLGASLLLCALTIAKARSVIRTREEWEKRPAVSAKPAAAP